MPPIFHRNSTVSLALNSRPPPRRLVISCHDESEKTPDQNVKSAMHYPVLASRARSPALARVGVYSAVPRRPRRASLRCWSCRTLEVWSHEPFPVAGRVERAPHSRTTYNGERDKAVNTHSVHVLGRSKEGEP